MSESLDFDLLPIDNKRLANLCGQFHEHMHQLERFFDVDISCSSNHFNVIGEV